MNTRRFIILMVGIASSCLLTDAANAQCNGGYGGGYYGWGIGGVYRSLDYPLDRRVPYFAAHPPVYYSYPVARTYGYSPFAYMPHVQTPEIIEAPMEPQEIMNPYVPATGQDGSADEQSEPSADTTTQLQRRPQPLLITNPYVTQVADQLRQTPLQVAYQAH